MCCPALLRACGNHSGEAERCSGIGLKLFGFIAEPVFAFIPESCSRSPRNAVRNHPESRSSCSGFPKSHSWRASTRPSPAIGCCCDADAGHPELQNESFEVRLTNFTSKYKGTDEAYAKLLGKRPDHQFAEMPPELCRNILAYCKNLNPPVPANSTKKEKAELTNLLDHLDRLKAVPDADSAPVAKALGLALRLSAHAVRLRSSINCA